MLRSPAILTVLVLGTSLQAQTTPFGPLKLIKPNRLFPSATIAADCNHDGIADLISGNGFSLDLLNGPGTVVMLEGTYSVKNHENLPMTGELGFVSHPAIGAGDFNGDRLVDLVTLSDRGTVVVLTHQGATRDIKAKPRFKASKPLYRVEAMARFAFELSVFRAYSLLVDDFTGDGKDDVVFCGDVQLLLDTIASSGLVVLPGDGHGGFSSPIIVSPERLLDLAYGDFDGDGRLDLVGLTPRHSIIVFLASDHGYRSNETSITGFSNATRIATGDLDSNGTDDILVSGGHERIAMTMYPSREDGWPGVPTMIQLPKRAQAAIDTITCADFDNDGDNDIAALIAVEAGSSDVLYFENRGGKFPTNVSIPLPATTSPTDVPTFLGHLRSADLNGDRVPELLVTSVTTKSNLVQHIVLPNPTKCHRGVQRMGTPLAGTGGLIPQITAVGGLPVVGNQKFGFYLVNVPANRDAVLVVGTRLLPPQGFWGATNVFPQYVFGTPTRGEGPGGGQAMLEMAIPDNPAFKGMTFLFQWLISDPAAKHPLRLSRSHVAAVYVEDK